MDTPIFQTNLTSQQIDLIEKVRMLELESIEHSEESSSALFRRNVQALFENNLMGLYIPATNAGLGLDFQTYSLVTAEMTRINPITALHWALHVCPTISTGQIMDVLEIPESKRLGHNRRRSVHYKRILESKAVYAHTFSFDTGADIGSSPYTVIAEPIAGGWLVNGKKTISNFSTQANYFSVLCTEIENRETPDREKTLYLAIPRHESGVSIEVQDKSRLATLVLSNVFIRERELLIPRGFYTKLEEQWPYLFLMFSPIYLGLAQTVYDCAVVDGRSNSSELEKVLEEGKELFCEVVFEGNRGEARAQIQKAKSTHCLLIDKTKKLLELAEIDNSKKEQFAIDIDYLEQLLPWTGSYCSEELS